MPLIVWVAFALPTALLAAMLALTPLGLWQMDEYFTISTFGAQGLPSLWQRILIWSPRPVSELLLFGYATVVTRTGLQLTGIFLAALWIGLFAACMLPAAWTVRRRRTSRRLPFLLSLTVLTLLVVGHPISEVFYWPQGAGAYLPTIALIAAPVLGMVFSERWSLKRDALTCICFSLAALASEVGAFFALAWGGTALGVALAQRWISRSSPLLRRNDVLLALPALAGLGVVYLLANARFANEAELVNSEVARRVGASLWSTLTSFPADVLAADFVAPTTVGLLLGIIGKSALLVLSILVFQRYRAALPELRLRVASVAVTALVAALFSLFAGFFQFGVHCCQRHQTFRSQLVVLAIVAGGWLLARSRVSGWLRSGPQSLIATASIVAVVASGAQTAVAVATDLAHYPQILQARKENWREGVSADTEMTYRLAHGGDAIGHVFVPTGTFLDGDQTPREILAMMRYFRKTRAVIE
ncbi:hypothetical protein [uncultured Aureimonas sp.]|uniref:hypothetical protein n=1 Tax=uncultured Aureimonas sp. TaxID=1604662 RepID=UPI0025DB2EBF|nr:hypothetical protein [uncultured Aureimonas sp.]